MTKLQECLYQYIDEERCASLTENEAYRLVRRQRDIAEERLTAALSDEQQRLFNQYMDQENYIVDMQLRHVFQETLLVVHDILNLSL